MRGTQLRGLGRGMREDVIVPSRMGVFHDGKRSEQKRFVISVETVV